MMSLFAICFFAGLALKLLITFFGGDISEFHVDSGAVHAHAGPSFFNLSSLLASMTVFGGVGYMLGSVGMTSVLQKMTLITFEIPGRYVKQYK